MDEPKPKILDSDPSIDWEWTDEDERESRQDELWTEHLHQVADLLETVKAYRQSISSQAIYSTEWFLYEQKIKNCLNKSQQARIKLRTFVAPNSRDVLPVNDDDPT